MDFNDVVSAQQRAQQVRNVLPALKPGDTLELPKGVYDFEDNGPVFPPNVQIIGASALVTVLQCAELWKKEQASAFTLSDGTRLEKLALESTCPMNRQSTVAGFSVESLTPRKATLTDVRILGRSWGLYLWQADGDQLMLYSTYVQAANVGICLGRSSGRNGQIVTCDGVRIKIDPSLSTQGGSTTNAVDGGSIGIAVRGGQLFADDLTVEAVGQVAGRGPMCVAISDHLEGGSSQSLITVSKLRSKLVAGTGTKILCDIDNQLGKVLIGGTGSAPDGGLLVRKTDTK